MVNYSSKRANLLILYGISDDYKLIFLFISRMLMPLVGCLYVFSPERYIRSFMNF